MAARLHVLGGGGALRIDAARERGGVVGGALLAAVCRNHELLARADLPQQLPLLRRQVVLVHVLALFMPRAFSNTR